MRYDKLILTLLLLAPISAMADYCLHCSRYFVNDYISIHRADKGEYFAIESYQIINTENSRYTTTVARRQMHDPHMFDLRINGSGTGSINIVLELNKSFTHKCKLVLHDSAEIPDLLLFVDTTHCDPHFHISPLIGADGYYFLKIGYFDEN